MQSWKVDDRVFQERLAGAVKSLREGAESLRQAQANLNRVRDRAMADWAEAMRGYRTVEHIPTGERTQVDLGWSQQIVDKLNELAGGRYFRAIPLRDE